MRVNTLISILEKLPMEAVVEFDDNTGSGRTVEIEAVQCTYQPKPMLAQAVIFGNQ